MMLGPEFSFPLRPAEAFYNASAFLSPDYYAARGKHHRGTDLNLLSGGDTDLGYPVSNCLPGVVVAAAQYGSWGGIVLVRADEWVRRWFMDMFERPIGSLEFQYAHLKHIPVVPGDVLNAGDCVGSVGKGGQDQYLAHLHFEVRLREYAPDAPQGGRDEDLDFAKRFHLDPEVVLKRAPFSNHPNTLAQKAYYAPTRLLSVEHAGERGALVHPVGDKLYLEGFDAS